MFSALPLTTDIDKALARRAAQRDADQKQWHVSRYHFAIILVLVAFGGLIAKITIVELLAHHHTDTIVGRDFVNDCRYYLVQTPTFRIVSRRDKVSALVGDELLGKRLFL
jgi:hypothetical protein